MSEIETGLVLIKNDVDFFESPSLTATTAFYANKEYIIETIAKNCLKK